MPLLTSTSNSDAFVGQLKAAFETSSSSSSNELLVSCYFDILHLQVVITVYWWCNPLSVGTEEGSRFFLECIGGESEGINKPV